MLHRYFSFAAVFGVLMTGALPAAAQTAPPGQAPRVTLPPVTVTAQKEPADKQTIPVSVTALSADWLRDAGVTWLSDAGAYVPNVFFSDFSARKLSNPRFRGIGSSPANPAITTYLDGVPQLSSNASSIELSGVEQIEFVRGPQSALFGRNTIGGVINVASERPSLAGWSGSVIAPVGNFGAVDLRASASGPLNDRVAVGFSGGYAQREGFTVNDISRNDVDARESLFGKAQLLWTPTRTWETRLLVSGERGRDGDYALGDLGQLRDNPFHVSRNFEGFTHRDIINTTIVNRREGGRVSFTSTTGFVNWQTEDLTDLDYSPLPAATRDNEENAFQFTQEFRIASAAAAPLALSPTVALKWQAGALLFSQNYEQLAVNSLAPFVISPLIPFAVAQTSPSAAIDDFGIGLYGQGTLTFKSRLDLILGARVDRESKEALLETSFAPMIAPPTRLEADESFSNVSPQIAVAYRLQPDRMIYGSFASGFKAGGFNPASPPGSEAYGEEQSRNIEAGLKTTWAGGRVTANAAVFFMDWTDLQLNLPSPFVPGQFYIANVGEATSRGLELELHARPASGVDVFGALGFTRARFSDDPGSSRLGIADRDVPNTPDYTLTLGAQLARAVTSRVTLFGRGEIVANGGFFYDESNTQAQDAFSLVNLRAGARGRRVFGELWVRNAFDTRYVPVAFAYPGLAPSGYIGEQGRPRTFGASFGLTF